MSRIFVIFKVEGARVGLLEKSHCANHLLGGGNGRAKRGIKVWQ